jgi:HEAT repeat protein
MLAVITDKAQDEKVRGDRLRDLGKMGATAVIPVATAIIADKDERNGVQEHAAWALGEVGHPDALPALTSAKGVNGYAVKTAIIKIKTY